MPDAVKLLFASRVYSFRQSVQRSRRFVIPRLAMIELKVELHFGGRSIPTLGSRKAGFILKLILRDIMPFRILRPFT